MAKANRQQAQRDDTTDHDENVDQETGEVLQAPTANPVNINQRKRAGKLASGLKFTKVKSVTVPVLKLMPDRPVYVRIESAMQVSKQVQAKKVGAAPMEPATIAHCVNLENDSECILIVGRMLKSVIDESYPDNGYVGKSFELVNHGMRGDKRYNSYSVNEVEVSDAADEPDDNGT